MEKPQFDFSKPMTFLNALEHQAFAQSRVMVALGDEVSFREEPDYALLNTACFFAH